MKVNNQIEKGDIVEYKMADVEYTGKVVSVNLPDVEISNGGLSVLRNLDHVKLVRKDEANILHAEIEQLKAERDAYRAKLQAIAAYPDDMGEPQDEEMYQFRKGVERMANLAKGELRRQAASRPIEPVETIVSRDWNYEPDWDDKL